jgi:hypothetical protein
MKPVLRIHRICKFLGLLDPQWFVLWSRSTSEKVRKTLIFLLLFHFLSLKTDVNVSSKSNKQNTMEKNTFFVGILSATDKKAGSGSGFGSESGSVSQWYGSPDPDPYQIVTDPPHSVTLLETKLYCTPPLLKCPCGASKWKNSVALCLWKPCGPPRIHDCAA